MPKIIDPSFMVCVDCGSWLANADASALDYHYSPEEAEQRLAEIQQGEVQAVADIPGGQIVCGDSDKGEDFSSRPCGCCGSRLAGERLHFAILGD